MEIRTAQLEVCWVEVGEGRSRRVVRERGWKCIVVVGVEDEVCGIDVVRRWGSGWICDARIVEL